MDRKSILVIVLCVGLLIGWNTLVNRLYPPKPAPARSTNTVTQVEAPAAGLTNNSGTNATGSVSPAVTAPAGSAASAFIVDTNTPEDLVVITNDNARYTFTSYGGGLKKVELIRYPETVRRKKDAQGDRVATLNAPNPTPTLAVLDGEAVQGNG